MGNRIDVIGEMETNSGRKISAGSKEHIREVIREGNKN